MEEAEHLCDRLGIFVDGSLQCVGNPKEVLLVFILLCKVRRGHMIVKLLNYLFHIKKILEG